jgi:coproporphyrinogen III oxidase-like Fe-S oxidoreductase
MVRTLNQRYLSLAPTDQSQLPAPKPGQEYMLYAHIPFCERLCPYCSFNRFPFQEQRALAYFDSLHQEMRLLERLGYRFKSLYVGGGTPTVMIDELCRLIDQARELFGVQEVSCETNPNHLIPEYLDKLQGRVQRLSVGVQSFDDGLLKQMDRYEKYGSSAEIMSRLRDVAGMFDNLNVDMIFNFPSQTEAMLRHDLESVLQSGTNQTTFYPLMASPSVERSLARTVGQVDYNREARYYQIISETLAGGDNPAFSFGSAWTFNARAAACGDALLTSSAGAGAAVGSARAGDTGAVEAASAGAMIDEYIVDYEEYPAIGSGGFSYLDGCLYANTFSLREYNEKLAAGRMSIMGKTVFAKRDRMRYRFMMELFGLRLDKQRWQRDFGTSVIAGVPGEYAFFKLAGAIAHEDDQQITLTAKGRYLMVALMRQFFIGVNSVRDQAREILPNDERELLFGCGAVTD